MDKVSETLTNLRETALAHLDSQQSERLSSLTAKLRSGEIKWEEYQIECYNDTPGDLQYYDCPKCRNRGEYARLVGGLEIHYQCDCMPTRRANRLLLESGLAEQIAAKTFENYQCDEPWQSTLKSKCMQFVEHPSHCLYLGGQSGSGKTHLCTAVCGKLVKMGKPVRYVLWRDLVTKLQANIFNDSLYTTLTDELKSVEILYIDDMFKLISSKPENRIKELEVAFKLINDREISNGITIISTELDIAGISRLDEAIAGRIVKMATSDYILQIGASPKRNYRFKNLSII